MEDNITPSTTVTTPTPAILQPKKPSKKRLVAAVGFGLAVLVTVVLLMHKSATAPAKSTTSKTPVSINQTITSTPTAKVIGLQLETTKNYGNKYADGVLPVGDNMHVTDAAKKGYVYECRVNFGQNGQGAGKRGPWFSTDNTTWDVNKKSTISGSVSWQQNISIDTKDGKRIISTNDLPNHPTGTFPVQRSDPAYKYDANPSTITAQSLVYTLPAQPSYGGPQCMGMESGIMTNGVALFNGFDADGRDAAAWEVQDSCDGHPQNKGEYHYHSLSRCITGQNVSKVIGFALDGFPITGPKVGDKNILTTSDLDECHGIVSNISLDNKNVNMYHYVMTQDFPYTVSCFRATPTQPPGRPER